ncbi:hypothetical protein LZD48_02875 [Oceanobacillus sp. APA_J-2(6-2)]|nr:hypothetical protein [Oceanobacillus alkalisoli]
MDSSKIILGVPLYGYDWELPYNPNTIATAISNHDAVDLAMRSGSPIRFSAEYASPYFYYADQFGQSHVVWFEDSTKSFRLLENTGFSVRELGKLVLALHKGLGF